MRLLPAQLAEAILAVDAYRNLDASLVARSVAALLKRRHAKKLTPALLRSLVRLSDSRASLVTVQATTALLPDASLTALIQTQAEGLFCQAGKRVEVAFHVDPSLVGGVRLATEDIQYDFSIDRVLRELKRQL